MSELLAIDCAMRDRALDLLAVDALVTYAFEAAAEHPESLAQRATTAMSSIAALAHARTERMNESLLTGRSGLAVLIDPDRTTMRRC